MPKNLNRWDIGAGHITRLTEEIVAHLTEYLTSHNRPISDLNTSSMRSYINSQVMRIARGMCSDEEFHPSKVDPQTVEGDYYRESIEEYGTLYNDYVPS